MILVSSFAASPAFSQTLDNSFEARMHRIYEQYYQRPILDDDWFKMVQGIQEQSYKVHAKDTLWDISEIYFGDGNYWSKLWSVNKNITNPHLIYVGDNILFSTGNFKEAPSISVEKLEESIQQAQEPRMNMSGSTNENTGEKFYRNPPSFFVESPILNLGTESSISIIPRPAMQYKNDFYLTSEILAEDPKPVAKVISVGADRMVSGESNHLVIEAQEQALNEGAILSIIDENTDFLSGGYGIKILGIIKIIRNIGDRQYEAEVLRQFDGLYAGSVVIAHIPAYANMSVEKPAGEADISLLSKDKEIWYTGDIVFLKVEGSGVQKGDILKIHNKFDRNIDFYTQNGIIKVVSVQKPFATAVVIHTKTAMDRTSVSAPKKSDFRFW